MGGEAVEGQCRGLAPLRTQRTLARRGSSGKDPWMRILNHSFAVACLVGWIGVTARSQLAPDVVALDLAFGAIVSPNARLGTQRTTSATRGIGEDEDLQARRLVDERGQRMLRHDLADVGSRDDDDAGLHAQPGGNRLFDGYGGVALPTRRHGEDHVAAVEHRADVQVAEALDESPGGPPSPRAWRVRR